MATDELAAHPLVQFLRDPGAATQNLSNASWNTLLRGARRSNLLCKAACRAIDAGLESRLPPKVAFHFRSAERVAHSGHQSALREIRHIEQALAPAGIPCLLLKGAAYVAGDLAAGKGRLMTDIDILVPHDRLRETEVAMVQAGWVTTIIDAYDQRYYRQWMHELPPMRHRTRGTSLDIHHTILPPTARLKPDVNLLWEDARSLAEPHDCMVLAPIDMILHSATHLFHEGEFANGLRDLFDLDALVREFSSTDRFWSRLLARAEQLDLCRPLYYAMRYCQRVIGTPVPLDTQVQLRDFAPPGPMPLVMDQLVMRSIGSILELSSPGANAPALFAMYVRSHYLRMPMRLLVPHLLRKQFSAKHR